jgi:hypothetical protein
MTLNSVVWILLVATTAIAPGLGALGLIFGFSLADKLFALINIADLVRLPLFITEPVLFILLIRAIIVSFRKGELLTWPLSWRSPWFWFYVIGLYNVAVGAASGNIIEVVRDAAMVFYAVVAQITTVYVRDTRTIKRIYLTLLLGLCVRMVLQIFSPVFSCVSSAFGMYAAFVVIIMVCTQSSCGRLKWAQAPLMAALLFFIALSLVRSVWVGLFIAFLYLGILLLITRRSIRDYLRAPTLAAGFFIISLFIMHRYSPSSFQNVKSEFFSLFAGKNSPNVMTRLAMWEDAIQEVLPASSKILNILDRHILNPFYYDGSPDRPSDEELKRLQKRASHAYHSADPSATDILTKFEISSVSQKSTKAPEQPAKPAEIKHVEEEVSQSIQEVGSRKTMRTLFGVPFGQRFTPERISALHQVNRYDPHNSLIAIFYRAGLIGFVLFIWIVVSVIRNSLKALKNTSNTENANIMISILTCIVYHIGHSLTDVTLENPFKGIPFWLLLGLAIAMTEIIRNENNKT